MKYLRLYLLAIQTNLQYRANTIGWILVGIVPSITYIVIWLAAMGGRTNVGGFARGDFIVYFLFGTLSWYIIGGTFSYQMGEGIKFGELNKFLLKPINYTFDHFVKEQAWKSVALVFTVPLITICLLFFWKDIHIQWSLVKIVTLLLSTAAGAVIFALLQALVGLSAFWFTDLWSVIELDDIMMGLFGGRVAPLMIMPSFVQNIADVLPYKYVFYTPLLILLDKSTTPFVEIQKQILYCVILFIAFLLLWKWGLKRYEAVGG